MIQTLVITMDSLWSSIQKTFEYIYSKAWHFKFYVHPTMMSFLFLEKMFYLPFYTIGSGCYSDSGTNHWLPAELGVHLGNSVLVHLVELGVDLVLTVHNVLLQQVLGDGLYSGCGVQWMLQTEGQCVIVNTCTQQRGSV